MNSLWGNILGSGSLSPLESGTNAARSLILNARDT